MPLASSSSTLNGLQAPPKHSHLACSLPAFASALSLLECLPYLSPPLPSCLPRTLQTWNPPVCSDLSCSYHYPLTMRNTRLIFCLLNQTLRSLWPQLWPAGLCVHGIQQRAWPIVTLPCMSVEALMCLVAQSYLALCDHMDCSPPGSFVHRDSPGQNTGVGCYILFQGIFPTQASNPPKLQADSLPSEPPGKPYILKYYSYINSFHIHYVLGIV